MGPSWVGLEVELTGEDLAGQTFGQGLKLLVQGGAAPGASRAHLRVFCEGSSDGESLVWMAT